jgi:hypothetical protein
MKHIPHFALMDEWTPSQALAVYDFCRLLSETLWLRYHDVLLEQMIACDRAHGFEHLEPPNDNLPFDDDMPF